MVVSVDQIYATQHCCMVEPGMSFLLLPVSVMANFLDGIEEDVRLRILTSSHRLVQQIMMSGESDTRKENALLALVAWQDREEPTSG